MRSEGEVSAAIDRLKPLLDISENLYLNSGIVNAERALRWVLEEEPDMPYHPISTTLWSDT